MNVAGFKARTLNRVTATIDNRWRARTEAVLTAAHRFAQGANLEFEEAPVARDGEALETLE